MGVVEKSRSNMPLVLIIACISVVVAWIGIVLLGLMLIVGHLGALDKEMRTPFLITLSGTAFATAVFALAAFFTRCPECHRKFLVQTYQGKIFGARTGFGLDLWASAVIDILRWGSCSCMYCGRRISVKDA